METKRIELFTGKVQTSLATLVHAPPNICLLCEPPQPRSDQVGAGLFLVQMQGFEPRTNTFVECCLSIRTPAKWWELLVTLQPLLLFRQSLISLS